MIIGNLDLLREKFRNQGTNRELIDDSLSSALSGRELVQRLLAFGSRQGLEPEPVDPNNIVLRLSRLLKRKLGETIKIRSVLNDDLWPIAVDKRQFEMSLLNLIFIARDAMTHGGRLTIESKNIVVHPPFGEHETSEFASHVSCWDGPDCGCNPARRHARRRLVRAWSPH